MLPLDEIEFEEKEHVSGETRTDVFRALLLLAPAMLMSTTGQLFLKYGMNQVGAFEFSTNAILAILPRVLTSPFIWLGFIGFMGGSAFWLAVISRVQLSLAYPVLALNYLIIVIESWLILKEDVSPGRIGGVAVIVVGVIVVGLSESIRKRG
jgi:drug/metabolite transporter (DMT)-like permease